MLQMAQHRTIIRHFLIINKVRRPGFPGLREIREMLVEHDFNISTRTLQRDIKNIRNEFGIEIRYNSFHNGYDIDYERSMDMDSLMKFLEMAASTGTFHEFYRDTNQVRQFVSFDSEEAIKGVDYISNILFALKNSRELVIEYQRFSDAAPYEVTIRPGLLKEYQNRWYIIGILPDGGAVRAYALDRIVDLQVGERNFDGSDTAGMKERFSHVIGISMSDRKPELIEITFDSDQAKYIETLPWHPSQEVARRSERETTFSLFVVPNYELEQKILSEGNHIKKVEPEWFSQQVKKRK